MDIGSRIKLRRKEMKLTQEALARRVRVTAAAVSNWEAGKNELSGDSLVAVAAELGVSAMWLQTGRGDKNSGSMSSPQRQLLPREAALLDLFASLTDDQQDEYFRALETQKHANQTLWEQLSKKMGGKR
jgi:transcriptional regulator with XRE-family HTH domain|nr:helix-turn-helix domain-containing protein [Thiothrix sp.]